MNYKLMKKVKMVEFLTVKAGVESLSEENADKLYNSVCNVMSKVGVLDSYEAKIKKFPEAWKASKSLAWYSMDYLYSEINKNSSIVSSENEEAVEVLTNIYLGLAQQKVKVSLSFYEQLFRRVSNAAAELFHTLEESGLGDSEEVKGVKLMQVSDDPAELVSSLIEYLRDFSKMIKVCKEKNIVISDRIKEVYAELLAFRLYFIHTYNTLGNDKLESEPEVSVQWAILEIADDIAA